MATDFDPTTLVCDYGDSRAEARAARRSSALFDFSFMARARLSGVGAPALLSRFQSRRLDAMQPGQICYTLRYDEQEQDQGHVVADLTLWKLPSGDFEIVSGRQRDIQDLSQLAKTDNTVEFQDLSSQHVIFALQGPDALAALRGIADTQRLAELAYFRFNDFSIADIPCVVGRLGYTGERGFEIIAPHNKGERLWSLLAERSTPAGFAAADSLRIEAGFMLFANECLIKPTAAELDLAAFSNTSNDRPRFQLVCFRAASQQPSAALLWRPKKPPLAPPKSSEIIVSSACYSTVAGTTLGLGFARLEDIGLEKPGLIDASGEFDDIRLVAKPFYDPNKQIPRSTWPWSDY